MRKALIAMLFMVASASQAAPDLKTGWRVEFQQDTFAKAVFAVGYAVQQSETVSFDSSQIQIYCDKKGGLVAAYSPGGLILSLDSAYDVTFRAEDNSTLDVTFKDMKAAGDRAINGASPEATAKLISVFQTSTQPIAFKTKDKQGVFPVAGSASAMAAVKSSCK